MKEKLIVTLASIGFGLLLGYVIHTDNQKQNSAPSTYFISYVLVNATQQQYGSGQVNFAPNKHISTDDINDITKTLLKQNTNFNSCCLLSINKLD